MASPACEPPPGTDSHDEAVEILRRLEPVLSRMTADLAEVKADVKRLDQGQRKQGEDIAELKGRMAGIEGQLRQVPTLWQTGTTMLALNSGIVAVAALVVGLIRYASNP